MSPTNETIKFKYYLSESYLNQPINTRNTRNRGVYKLKGLAQTISTLADNVADKYDSLSGILMQCHQKIMGAWKLSVFRPESVIHLEVFVE